MELQGFSEDSSFLQLHKPTQSDIVLTGHLGCGEVNKVILHEGV